ncbi:hypothetical protein BAUCODRAFT_172865 [Baudoinia panamericana UAMH 10762]|uniref:Uncharacterized protein n=1 Tax=Baudoinia panamericana (strain UAMH 10762) TaxID=717646 RepID=M2NM24_BAUPA|nr:uncharacterized protein BAUCODRAFT_172865 [Baudoinia panamericana UAMH 10762]EMD00540.1 hypothetical protein BAUCODRAFT_172865 [Baudoinia panamericana UAMH 10762]
MTDSIAPQPPLEQTEADVSEHASASIVANGHVPTDRISALTANAAPIGSIDPDSREDGSHATVLESDNAVTHNGGNDDAASEAETLIQTPVKKRVAERHAGATMAEKPAKSRIGGLPVPGDDDEESESVATPMQSTELGDAKASRDAKDELPDEMDMASDQGEDDSGSLSSPQSPALTGVSMASGRSRALSEEPDLDRGIETSDNPRKRKFRASSVSLPNKRQSMDPPKRRLRGMQSDDNRTMPERSPSPKPRSHRRAVSTQSAFMDGSAEIAGKKRQTLAHFPVRDPKVKAAWEESDASSETTSHGQVDVRRPQRGVGRSTSTPGRPTGPHKRHVNKYGFTKLAEACESADMDAIKEWMEKDPDQLELAEFAGNKPLQIAALNGNVEVVDYLIKQGCKIDCANVDKDTPLIDAAENGHLAVVEKLLDAGVDPLRQNLKGQQALDVVTDETEDADEIRTALREAIELWNSEDAKQKREEEEEQRYNAGPSKELHFMARTYENLLRLVTINDRNGVREFLDARVPVDNNIIAAAAKTGDQYLVNMLLAEMTEKKAYQKAEKPMLAVLGTSHFEMVQMLTALDPFNPIWRSRSGKSWPELADEKNGPNRARERELLQKLYDGHTRALGRRSSSPVTKREYGKRRPIKHNGSEDDEEEDGGHAMPVRKNGRRLMSRRDMRKAHSDYESEDDDSASDTAVATADAHVRRHSMKPPDSPNQQHRIGQPRRKSMSSQPSDPSPRNRRRSSSLRGPQDPALPTVLERVEGVERVRVMRADREMHVKRPEEQRNDEGTAHAEAKRIEAEAKRIVEEGEAEEMRRQEEHERKQAEEARKVAEAEEARKAEEEAKVEAERLRMELEMEGARSSFRRDVLATLPEEMSRVLDPTATIRLEGPQARQHVWRLCTPIYVVSETDGATAEDCWILNLQAALLLGKRGLELLLPQDNLGFERTFSRGWATRSNLSQQEQKNVEYVLNRLAVTSRMLREAQAVDRDGDSGMTNAQSFQAELEQAAERLRATAYAERTLNNGLVRLEVVRLLDVLGSMDPLLKHCTFQLRLLSPSKPSPAVRTSPGEPYPSRLDAWRQPFPIIREVRAGRLVEAPEPMAGKTQLYVAHEK